jgi:hypothetical protein
MAALAGICGDASFGRERFTISIKVLPKAPNPSAAVSNRDDSNINNDAIQTRQDDNLDFDSDDACTNLCRYARVVKHGACTG